MAGCLCRPSINADLEAYLHPSCLWVTGTSPVMTIGMGVECPSLLLLLLLLVVGDPA